MMKLLDTVFYDLEQAMRNYVSIYNCNVILFEKNTQRL